MRTLRTRLTSSIASISLLSLCLSFAPPLTTSFAVSSDYWKLWGTTSATFYLLPIGQSIVLKGLATEAENPILTNYKTDQLDCHSVPPSYGGQETNNAQWECTALATGNSNSEVYYYLAGDPSQRSSTIVIQVEPEEVLPAVSGVRFSSDFNTATVSLSSVPQGRVSLQFEIYGENEEGVLRDGGTLQSGQQISVSGLRSMFEAEGRDNYEVTFAACPVSMHYDGTGIRPGCGGSHTVDVAFNDDEPMPRVTGIRFSSDFNTATVSLSTAPRDKVSLQYEIYGENEEGPLRDGGVLQGGQQISVYGFRSMFELEGRDDYEVAFAACPSSMHFEGTGIRQGCGDPYTVDVAFKDNESAPGWKGLSLTVSAPSSAVLGGSIQYKATVSNNGSQTVDGILISDTSPFEAGLEYDPSHSDRDCPYDGSEHCKAFSLRGGMSRTLILAYTIVPNARCGNEFGNTVNVYAPGMTMEDGIDKRKTVITKMRCSDSGDDDSDEGMITADISKIMYAEGKGFNGYKAAPLEVKYNEGNNVTERASQGMYRGSFPHESFGINVKRYDSSDTAIGGFGEMHQRTLGGDAHFLTNEMDFGNEAFCYIAEKYTYHSGDCGGACKDVSFPYRNFDCTFREENVLVSASTALKDTYTKKEQVDHQVIVFAKEVLGQYEKRLEKLASGGNPDQGNSPGNPPTTTPPVTTTPGKIPPAGYEDEVRVNYVPEENPFPDTDVMELEGLAAAELYRRAVIGGFPDGQFKGDRPVNRAEAAKFLMLARYNGIDDVYFENRFPDVKEGEWYTLFVLMAARLGVINGHPDGLFRPANQVLTSEFLKMLSLTFGLEDRTPYPYNDVPSDAWYAQYTGIAHAFSLFPDRGANLLPGKPLTRGEVAIAIYQFLKNRNNPLSW